MPRPTLFDHPKFQRLAKILNIPRPHALGLLEFIWRIGYSSGNDEIGDEIDVELAAEWNGEPGALVRALIDPRVRLLDKHDNGAYAIHDLWHHAPEYVTRRRAQEAERRRSKKCKNCRNVFFSSDKKSLYCSASCRQASYRKRDEPVTNRDEPLRNSDRRVTQRDGTHAPAPAPAPAHSTESSRTTPAKKPRAMTAKIAPKAQDLQALWNATVSAPLPQCQNLSPSRRRAAAVRLSDRKLEEWKPVIERIVRSDFCRGVGERSSGWVADFDWLLKPDTATRVLEGKYDNRPTTARHVNGHGVERARPRVPSVEETKAFLQNMDDELAARKKAKPS